MSRSSGTYTAPTSGWKPAAEGSVIDSSDWNTLLDDIEAAVTESVYTGGLGATDNALVRTDGTDTKKAQGSTPTISDTGILSGVATFKLTAYTIGTLPAGTEGQIAYASDWDVNGGASSGSLVFHDGEAWRGVDTGTTTSGVAAPYNTVLPVISGTTTEGETLSTTDGTWLQSPTSYTYQWKRDGVSIGGATSNTYLLVLADVGTTITVTVTATNAAGSTAATSAGVGPISASFTGALDGLSTSASAAWSVYRALRSSYTGSLIRVRRSSDNTEQDIGYVTGGLLDTSALTTFAGAGNAFVVKIYDQSGNGRDATQSTNSNQPQIVSSGSVVTSINSKACMDLDGLNHFLVTATDADNIIGTSEYCMFAIARPDSGTLQNDSQPYDSPAIAGGYPNGVWCFAGMSTNGTNHIQCYNYDGTHDVATRTLSYPSTHVFTMYRRNDTGFVHAHIDGGGAGGSVASGSRTAAASNKFGIGRHYTGGVNNHWFDGKIMEVIAFATLPSLADRNTLGANQATVAGVSWTDIT